MLAMLWQSVALAPAGSTLSALADMEHNALHWQEEGHHDHVDGYYHLHNSPESVRHVVSDHVSAYVALLVSASHESRPWHRQPPVACTRSLCPTPTQNACSGRLVPAPDPPSRRASTHVRPAFRRNGLPRKLLSANGVT